MRKARRLGRHGGRELVRGSLFVCIVLFSLCLLLLLLLFFIKFRVVGVSRAFWFRFLFVQFAACFGPLVLGRFGAAGALGGFSCRSGVMLGGLRI